MADDFGARRSPRLAGDEGALVGAAEPFGERRDLRRLSSPLTAFEGDESPALRMFFGACPAHGQSFSAPARNIPITSSLAPSIARRTVEPVATDSAATTGASTATLVPRQTLTKPPRWPGSTGEGTGPL